MYGYVWVFWEDKKDEEESHKSSDNGVYLENDDSAKISKLKETSVKPEMKEIYPDASEKREVSPDMFPGGPW